MFRWDFVSLSRDKNACSTSPSPPVRLVIGLVLGNSLGSALTHVPYFSSPKPCSYSLLNQCSTLSIYTPTKEPRLQSSTGTIQSMAWSTKSLSLFSNHSHAASNPGNPEDIDAVD